MMDLSIEVTVPDTALFRGEGAEVVRHQLVADTEFALSAIHGAIVPRTPINQGFLRNAWGTKVEVTGTGVDVLGRVFNPMAHANPIEHGAHWPGAMPPVDALVLWVRRKLGVAEKEVRGVAFVVARALKRRGLAPRNMARDGVESVRGAVRARFDAGLAAIVQRLGHK